MFESLLALSFAFLGYVIYALVSEQIACNAKAAKRPTQSAKPLISNTKSTAAATTKKKPATTTTAKPKPVVKPKPATKPKPAAAKKKPSAKPRNQS